MNERVREFLKAASKDGAWFAQHENLENKDEAISAAVAKAAEMGIPLAASDFDAPQGELSEDELAAVAGGGKCVCFAGGGGTQDDAVHCANSGYQDQVCWCVVYGEGWKDDHSSTDGPVTGETQRCECPMVGNGE